MSCGVGHRHGSDLVLLRLWPRPEAVAPIRPIACEPPCAAGAALKGKKKKKNKTKKKKKNKTKKQKTNQERNSRKDNAWGEYGASEPASPNNH